MYTHHGQIYWAGILVVALMFSGVFATRAQADDTGRILAGLAAGALVYSALDHDGDSCRTSHHYHHYDRGRTSPPPHRRYDPPRYHSYESPRHSYDRGYDDGWDDGYDYGKAKGRRQGYHRGYDRGYDHGYGDGRHDQWRADHNIGRPYTRHAEKSYGW